MRIECLTTFLDGRERFEKGDIFTVSDGKITETQVWNDSAEILLDRHGLAEAPL